MATTAQIQLALQRAQAAGNAQDVAALQQALTQSQQETGAPQSAQTTRRGPWDNYAPTRRYVVTSPEGKQYEVTAPASASQADVMAYAQRQAAQSAQGGPWTNYARTAAPNPFDQFDQPAQGPTREQVSKAFYRAKAAGDEGAARQLVGYLQQHGMTLAPMDSAQEDAAFQKANARNVAGMNDVTLGVPGVNALQITFPAPAGVARTVAGIGEGAANFYNGLKQHLYDPIVDKIDGGNRVQQAQQQVAENRRLSQALNTTTGGKVGNVLGGVMSSAPLTLIPGGGESALARTGLAVLTGAGFGYIAPSASGGEHVSNTLLGAAAGPLAVGAGKIAQLLGRGGKAVLQRYVAPDAVAGSRIGRILAGEGVMPAQLRTYADPVTGVRPTLAQVLQTPKAVQLERAARNNPISGPDIAAHDLQNSAARMSALQQHVIAPADVAAARASRSANFAPTADALDNAGSVDVGPLRFEASNLAQRGHNATTRAAAKKVLSFIDDNTAAGMMPVSDLHTLQHDLGTIVKQANPESINTAAALHELQPFKSAIVETVDSLVPGYRSALQQYAMDSAPISTSRTIGGLLSPNNATATDLTGEPTLTAARLKSVLLKDSRAPFKMTPQARQDVESVLASIQSRNAAQRSIGPMGLPTEENRLNQLLNSGARHAGATTGALAGSYVAPGAGTIAGLLLGHGADMVDRAAQNRISGAIGRLLVDPNATADSLDVYLQQQARRRAFNNRLVPTYLGRNWLGYGSGLVPNLISTNASAPQDQQAEVVR